MDFPLVSCITMSIWFYVNNNIPIPSIFKLYPSSIVTSHTIQVLISWNKFLLPTMWSLQPLPTNYVLDLLELEDVKVIKKWFWSFYTTIFSCSFFLFNNLLLYYHTSPKNYTLVLNFFSQSILLFCLAPSICFNAVIILIKSTLHIFII